MNAPTTAPVDTDPDLVVDIAQACDRIAPTWPLDQFIAVNPYWGWRESPVAEVSANLALLAGTPLTMPRRWFREEWQVGRLDVGHLDAVATEMERPDLADLARSLLQEDDVTGRPLERMALLTDLRDADGGPIPGQSWTELVVHQIGQHLAAQFDEWQASWAPDRTVDLFTSWRTDPSVTHGFPWRHGSDWARSRLLGLPRTPTAATAQVLDELAVPTAGRKAYLTALLASVNGWAAWCAYRRWQARLVDDEDQEIVGLLAIRLAWEWLLASDVGPDGPLTGDESLGGTALHLWRESWVHVDEFAGHTADEQAVDWLLQAAVERTYQDTIIEGLPQASSRSTAPEAQAVFCIDVRSEVFRRALESTSEAIHTRGFAGFFGLPIDYSPVGSALTRPQVPGLLSPALHVTEAGDGTGEVDRTTVLRNRERWQAFRRDPSSVFTFVESLGLTYGWKLVKESLPHDHSPARWENDGLSVEAAGLRPRLAVVDENPAAAAEIGQRVLTGMGLLEGFAPVVLLCGHGSHTANNPHAAGLDCGACGGQTGEVNARVLADLLDSPAVRQELAALGVHIPDSTWFVAGLHDTTTDTVELFDTDLAPASHRAAIEQLASRLADAGRVARTERAPSLGLGGLVNDPVRLAATINERANDWSQVRPEWGLTGNASFVVAPRDRSRHLDLEGRTFLHDYDWRTDHDLSVLTLIMTAPMVVTNWINMQYYASTIDNRRYGSGNKVLHNVVGGRLGVFEGNGGDLRIGLPMQSLHDGVELRHRPLRLSVFIEAPRDSIDSVIAGHQVVRDLVENGWLNLLRIDSDNGAVERRLREGWQPTSA